jgi:proteasome accessory factor B
VGLDREKSAVRTFRLDRIVSEVSVSKKVKSFDAPETIPDQDTDETSELAVLRVRKNRGHQLRSLAKLVEAGEDWDEITLPILDDSWLVRTILWHRDDVIALQPPALKKRIVDSLKELGSLHA